MSKKSMPLTGIRDDFKLTDKTILHVTERYPTVDIEKTLERFVETCEANGTMYADWQAGFRTWVRRNVEEKWKGVAYKEGKSQDPAWMPILNEVAPYGFRQPMPHETPGSYRTEFNLWKGKQHRAPVIGIGDALKKMGS